MVDRKRIELSSSACKAEILPLNYQPNQQQRSVSYAGTLQRPCCWQDVEESNLCLWIWNPGGHHDLRPSSAPYGDRTRLMLD